jgi:alkylation response protein AidB-like acyl-CoA dehydrogenase
VLLPTGIRRVKDPIHVVEAFSVWNVVEPRAHLAVVGAMLEPDYATGAMRALAERPGVHYLAPLPRPQMLAAIAEADIVLNTMKSTLQATLGDYHRLLLGDDPESFSSFAFAIRVNNLKLTCSQQLLDVVMRSMVICGISGYRNDSKLSLGRHLRDATGAGLMVNNDRILGQNATMHVGLRD